MKNNIVIFCDGGSRGNPGPASSAFVVVQSGKTIHKGASYLGVATNNQAEYHSVLLAVTWIKSSVVGSGEIIINLDSLLMERQLNNFYKTKNPLLLKLKNEIMTVVNKLDQKIIFVWNRRDKNMLADELVNETLDKHLALEN